MDNPAILRHGADPKPKFDGRPLQVLIINFTFHRRILELVARHQGVKYDRFSGEEPGKVTRNASMIVTIVVTISLIFTQTLTLL